jgi:hypothetical protein
MRLFNYILFFFFLPQLIFGQTDSIIKTEVYFDSSPPETPVDSFFNSIPNILRISFMEGFNDSVFVYKNGKCIDSLLLVTNESIGYAGGIGLVFKSKEEVIDLTLLFKRSGAILKERLNPNFAHLEIRRFNQWKLFYSNHFPVLE